MRNKSNSTGHHKLVFYIKGVPPPTFGYSLIGRTGNLSPNSTSQARWISWLRILKLDEKSRKINRTKLPNPLSTLGHPKKMISFNIISLAKYQTKLDLVYLRWCIPASFSLYSKRDYVQVFSMKVLFSSLDVLPGIYNSCYRFWIDCLWLRDTLPFTYHLPF